MNSITSIYLINPFLARHRYKKERAFQPNRRQARPRKL